MTKEEQIETTDWLTRDITKEQLEREKLEAIMAYDLEECLIEFESGGDIYTDYDLTAQKMVARGYRKQSGWISVEDRFPTEMGDYLVCVTVDNERVMAVAHFTPYSSRNSWIECGVTHWMHIPNLPKRKEQT